MDFSKYGLEDDVVEKLKKDYDVDITGLKNKNADLIDREKQAKQTNEELTLKLSTQEEDAKVALAEKEGTVEQYKNAISERDQKIETIQREFKETESARVMDSAVNDFLSKEVTSNPRDRHWMESQFRDSLHVIDGVLKPKDVTIGDVEVLKQKLVSDEANAECIKAGVGSGSGSQGGQGGFNKVDPVKKVTSATSGYLATTQ